MRLVDLEPRWSGMHGWTGTDVFYIGITYLCPHCRKQRLRVLFRNPIDPANLRERYGWTWTIEEAYHMPTWERTGDTFDALTLIPSIDVSKDGHWHGHITNGEVIPDV